jgi:hypothetical protein
MAAKAARDRMAAKEDGAATARIANWGGMAVTADPVGTVESADPVDKEETEA